MPTISMRTATKIDSKSLDFTGSTFLNRIIDENMFYSSTYYGSYSPSATDTLLWVQYYDGSIDNYSLIFGSLGDYVDVTHGVYQSSSSVENVAGLSQEN